MKDLLQEAQLIWSPVVANIAMNRERRASGINSYEQEFGFRPELFLQERIKQQRRAAWLDICCGQGNALHQAAARFNKQTAQGEILLQGIDLIGHFSPAAPGSVRPVFEVASAVDWRWSRKYDLITCSHGLHYVGDKLNVLQHALSALEAEGMFIANLDLRSIFIDGETAVPHLTALLKAHHILYHKHKRLVSCNGPADLQTGLAYLGADDQAGPNYTGQAAVNAYYTFS